MVKKHYALRWALLATVGLSATMTSSAFAVETLSASWLNSGSAIVSLTSITIEEKLLLEDEKVPIIGKVAVVCESIFDGSVGPNGESEVTEMLNLSGEKIEGGRPLSCEKQTGCEAAGKVVPVGLPWHSLLELEEPAGVFAVLGLMSAAGYEVECTVFGIKSTDDCTSLEHSGGRASNGSSDVLLTAETITPNGNCSIGGNGAGKAQVIEGLISILSGTLGISSVS
ncbi:MAG TPA: hypothetical protein VK701_06560 [Solirubrobacteraceae bacterium]|jgi:hypothetical protein|nr:hypothetical protein [Solirubrobacteraceae bacterium]